MHKFKIAIVDDEVDFLEVLQMFIEDDPAYAAFDVNFYASAQECLKDIEVLDYILTDLNMPQMDGFGLISEAKKLNSKIKISVMSAYSDEANKDRARQLGVLSYFVKPLDFDIVRLHLCATFDIPVNY